MTKTAALAETATKTAEHSASDSVWMNPETWVSVAFVVFVALALRYLVPMINKSLDARADKIRDQLEQAKRLRAEAQELLKTYRREQEAKLKEAEETLANAKRDAVEMRARAAEELKQNLERRTEQAKEKIARAEQEAVAQIRNEIIEAATHMAQSMLVARMGNMSEDPTIARAIASIERQIH